MATVIPGARSAAYVELDIDAFETSIAAESWAELKHEGLLHEEAPVLE